MWAACVRWLLGQMEDPRLGILPLLATQGAPGWVLRGLLLFLKH